MHVAFALLLERGKKDAKDFMMGQLFSSAIRCTSLSVLLSLFAASANAQAPIVPPGAPTIVSVTPGYAKVLITVAAPLSDGGSVITGYTANCLNVTGNDIRKFISGGTGNKIGRASCRERVYSSV